MASSGSSFDPVAAAPSSNYYCHRCNTRTLVNVEDFTCSTCGSGFIEEVPLDEEALGSSSESWDDAESDATNPDHHDVMMVPSFLEQLLGSQATQPGTSARTPTGRGRGGGRFRAGYRMPRDGQHAFGGLPDDPFLHSILRNLMGGAPGLSGGIPAHIQFISPGNVMGGGGANVIYGNPGDYAWGRGGFDAIVTQLLNQMEGTGPPPMSKESIDTIPTVKVDQEHVDQKMQCSVCWEDFRLDESVRRLKCDHIFHGDCILPWLELHATCPVCRKPLSQAAEMSQRGEGITTPQDADAGRSNDFDEASESNSQFSSSRPMEVDDPPSANASSLVQSTPSSDDPDSYAFSFVMSHLFGQPSPSGLSSSATRGNTSGSAVSSGGSGFASTSTGVSSNNFGNRETTTSTAENDDVAASRGSSERNRRGSKDGDSSSGKRESQFRDMDLE